MVLETCHLFRWLFAAACPTWWLRIVRASILPKRLRSRLRLPQLMSLPLPQLERERKEKEERRKVNEERKEKEERKVAVARNSAPCNMRFRLKAKTVTNAI